MTSLAKRSHRPIFLVGPPGSGKSTIGAAACATLGLRFAEAPATGNLPDADVVAVPWSRSTERALWRDARSAGVLIGLWAHPQVMALRSDPPYHCIPSRKLKTFGGFGPSGEAAREFRLLDRHCVAVANLTGVDLPTAVAEITEAIREAREPVDLAAEARASLDGWVAYCIDDCKVKPAAVHVALDAMAGWLAHLIEQGISPRNLTGVRSDLQAALYLVCNYDSPTAATMLREFASVPHEYEFSRKFSGSSALTQRYCRTLAAFSVWLEAGANLDASNRNADTTTRTRTGPVPNEWKSAL